MKTPDFKTFFQKPFWSNPKTLLGLWLIVGIVSAVTKLSPHRCNNFLIFKGVFWHTWNQTSLFDAYPAEYFDVNHYGPLFSLIIAPFAVMPHALGMILWCAGLAMLCWVAVRKSTLNAGQQIFVYWFCAHDLLSALFMQQFNVAIAAILLLSFFFIEREKDGWATLMILIGTFVKLYGIVGLAFFFFSRHKVKFILSFLGWSILLFVAPMCISSPAYIIDQYREWYVCLVEKNSENTFTLMQNISLLGMVRKISQSASYSDLWLIIPGFILFCAPYLRLKQWQHLAFRQMFLASVMMFMVLFSTGTENSGYITATIGCVIWFSCVPWKRGKWDIALMVFCILLTSLSTSDLFPAYVRENLIRPYALKALPVSIIWFRLCYEMLTRDYAPASGTHQCTSKSDTI